VALSGKESDRGRFIELQKLSLQQLEYGRAESVKLKAETES